MPTNKSIKNVVKAIYHFAKHQPVWLRPFPNNLMEMKTVLDTINDNNDEYAEFMIHSSELMPGGNPIFRSESDIEDLYSMLDSLFAYAIKQEFFGCTFQQYEKTRTNG